MSPADEWLELVGLLPAHWKTRALDPQDVRAAGAARDGLIRGRVADEPRRRHRCDGPQERPDPTHGERRPERQRRSPESHRDAGAVLGEVDRAEAVGREHFHSVGVCDRICAAGGGAEDADSNPGEDDLVAGQRLHAVGEGALQGAHVHDADCPDGHLADGAPVDDRDREVAGEGERKVRIRQHEAGATTDGVQAGPQGEPGRVLVVEREAIGRVDRADGLQRDAAVERVRRWRAARPDRAQHRRTDQSVERASNDALSCMHFRAFFVSVLRSPQGLAKSSPSRDACTVI